MTKTTLFLVVAFSLASTGENFPVPAGSKQLSAYKYQSSHSYRDTVRELSQRLVATKRMAVLGNEINLPHVRVTTFYNTNYNTNYNTKTKAIPSYVTIFTNLVSGITEILFTPQQKERH
jgi:hypothetical protein